MRPAIADDLDLDWLAFAYATGVLDAVAEAAFEERLDADQAVREALAAAVALVGVIVSARWPSRFRLVRAVKWATLAAAATLAAILILPSHHATTSAPSAETVALAWLGLHGGDDFLAALDDPPELPAEMSPDDEDAPPRGSSKRPACETNPTRTDQGGDHDNSRIRKANRIRDPPRGSVPGRRPPAWVRFARWVRARRGYRSCR